MSQHATIFFGWCVSVELARPGQDGQCHALSDTDSSVFHLIRAGPLSARQSTPDWTVRGPLGKVGSAFDLFGILPFPRRAAAFAVGTALNLRLSCERLARLSSVVVLEP